MTYFSTTRLRDGRTFWIVFAKWLRLKGNVPLPDATVIASGYAASKAAGLLAIRAAGGRYEQGTGAASGYHERHHEPQDGRPYSVAGVGSRGWRWVVGPGHGWDGLFHAACEDLEEGHTTGLASDRASAYAAARAAGGQFCVGAGFAAEVHAFFARERRAQRRSSTTDSQTVEYVYRLHRCWESCDQFGCHGEPTAHRVIKKTKLRLYVDERSADFPHRDPRDVVRTFVLDRAAIERGEIISKRWWEEWSGTPIARADRPASPACIAALELGWPTDERTVRRAYRRLARAMHPDTGGSEAAFVALRQSFEQALRLVGPVDSDRAWHG